MTKPIEITDEFTEPYGEWEGYDAIIPVQEAALRSQKHVDIRSFVPDQTEAQVTMFIMDSLTMFFLDEGELGLYSHDAEAKVIVANNEEWTFGEVGPQSDRNNWNGIQVECPANETTTTQSVING